METSVVIIGAGQAGLAMSRCLIDRGVDHVLLERGQVANSWRTERWDSLRLLTPNWMTRLPGFGYDGANPDGFMSNAEVIGHLDRYRASFTPDVRTGTTVEAVRRTDHGYTVTTDQGVWHCRSVVVATGACSNPHVPAIADELPAHIHQVTPTAYRNPGQIGDGGVLVVGASASGAQIADELARSGRDVTVAVGDHVRLPRSYRGMDIHWWMDVLGVLDERYDEMEDINRARRLPSLQLVGSPDKRNLDLNALMATGVQLTGRFSAVDGTTAQFSGSLPMLCTSADLKMRRLFKRIDEYAAEHGLDDELAPADPPPPTAIPDPVIALDLNGIDTVVWATGFRPQYPWLEPRLLDRKGAIRHDGGVMDDPGMYVLGLPFMRRRKSSFLDGVGPDAVDLADHLVAHLDDTARTLA